MLKDINTKRKSIEEQLKMVQSMINVFLPINKGHANKNNHFTPNRLVKI